jgi:predicted TIM-barrel fold metal-dependent hydrolase
MSVPFGMFDADNHYYEPVEAFTRHLDPAMQRRCLQWAQLEGRTRLLVAGRLCRFIPNPTFDPIARPGSLYAYFRGNSDGDVKAAFGDLERIADHPEYRNRDARLAVMAAQGVDACFLFPTLGVGMEEAMVGDPQAIHAAFHAFNEWLADDWGFAHHDRVFAAPYLSLADPARAVAELEWVLDRDARIVCLRPAPAPTAAGNRPPGDRSYDRFWALAAEAGVTVGFHSGDAGAAHLTRHWGGADAHESFAFSPFYLLLAADRPIYETMVALLTGGVLTRHPTLRVASIESGSEWVPVLFKKTKKVYLQQPHAFAEHPHETLRRQLWVSPHFEEDKRAVADLLGIDHVLMGSDWPHAEGLPQPADYRAELERDVFTPDEIRMVMRENGLPLTRRAPAPAPSR